MHTINAKTMLMILACWSVTPMAYGQSLNHLFDSDKKHVSDRESVPTQAAPWKQLRFDTSRLVNPTFRLSCDATTQAQNAPVGKPKLIMVPVECEGAGQSTHDRSRDKENRLQGQIVGDFGRLGVSARDFTEPAKTGRTWGDYIRAPGNCAYVERLLEQNRKSKKQLYSPGHFYVPESLKEGSSGRNGP